MANLDQESWGNSQNAENNKSHGMANKTFLNTAQTNYFSQGSHHYSNVKGLLMLRSTSQCIQQKNSIRKIEKGAVGKKRDVVIFGGGEVIKTILFQSPCLKMMFFNFRVVTLFST